MITNIEGFNEKVINEINQSGGITEVYDLIYDVEKICFSYDLVKAQEKSEMKHHKKYKNLGLDRAAYL